jgi:NTE family protein
MLKGDKLINFLGSKLKVSNFNELQIPLKVVATDYYKKKQVVIKEGDLLSAVRASYALPFLFSPVVREKKLLVDGGMVNPLPFDVIQDDCDITIAVDVSASNGASDKIETPPAYEILFSAFQIMQSSIINEKLKTKKPTIHIKTNLKDVRVHEFMKAEEIFKDAAPYKKELTKKLKELLSI